MSPVPFAAGSHAPTAVLARTPIEIRTPYITSKLALVWTGVLGASAADAKVSVSAWLSFLLDVQQEEKDAEAVVHAKSLPGDTQVDITWLHEYLCRASSTAIRIPDAAKRDASHPLTSYFISSSHNTYLVGHQLYGDSTAQGYINVLRRGCRCIEIDVWDGDDGEPQVFHGYTLTKEISFKAVCKAIRDHAFWAEADERGVAGEVADGPVIISLECHAGHAQQLRMVEIMKKVWAGLLVEAPFCGAATVHDVTAVPPLALLRGRILVKTKYLPRDAAAEAAPAVDQQQQDVSDSGSDSELEELSRQNNTKKPPRAKLSRDLAALAIYCGSSTFPGSFTHPAALRPTHVFSFSEKVFKSHAATMEAQIIEHNKQHFMRVYPFGLRFSSSNADPTLFWRRGVQLVALNWQKFDEGMMLNEAMFSGEGGYVLKPAHIRPGYTGPPPRERKLDLSIEVIAAQNLPLPDEDDRPEKFEPYVKVEVYLGNPAIEKGEEVKGRTRKAGNRGTDAAWEYTVKFKGVPGVVEGAEMLGFVRFKVNDEEFGKDDLAAWACVRLDRLRQGYRFVRLLDTKGRRTGSGKRGGKGEAVLLVRVRWSFS
ncbi:PLC-like phosphodiesterase [Peziza echinospora]|nr:PLC-like phosphodiesterase [Peziza echinospora]